MPVYPKRTPVIKTKPEKTIEIHCLYQPDPTKDTKMQLMLHTHGHKEKEFRDMAFHEVPFGD